MPVPPLNLQLVYTDGKPTRAIIDVAALEALLEAAEDLDDLAYVSGLKEQDLEFTSFEDYLRRSRAQGEGEGADDERLPDRHREAS